MEVWAILLAFVVTVAACGALLRAAKHLDLFDVPNQRSAHVRPVPRGGGLGIGAGCIAALLLLSAGGTTLVAPYAMLLSIAGALMIAGVLDDRYGLSVKLRLPLYALACLLATWLLVDGALPLWLTVAAAIYALWLLNLFNFMDGIDGIAAAEAGFVFLAAALLALWRGAEGIFPLLCLLLATACVAFLHWNWSPARLFMGDVGSIPLGFLLAVFSLQGELSGQLPLVSWLILLAVFIGDATYTLAWRALNGEQVTAAHSRHGYQRLARHWGSHGKVVMLMILYNTLWLLPLAVAALHFPQWAWACVLGAYLPLLTLRLKADKLP